MITERVFKAMLLFPLYSEKEDWTLPQDDAVHSDSIIIIFLVILGV